MSRASNLLFFLFFVRAKGRNDRKRNKETYQTGLIHGWASVESKFSAAFITENQSVLQKKQKQLLDGPVPLYVYALKRAYKLQDPIKVEDDNLKQKLQAVPSYQGVPCTDIIWKTLRQNETLERLVQNCCGFSTAVIFSVSQADWKEINAGGNRIRLTSFNIQRRKDVKINDDLTTFRAMVTPTTRAEPITHKKQNQKAAGVRQYVNLYKRESLAFMHYTKLSTKPENDGAIQALYAHISQFGLTWHDFLGRNPVVRLETFKSKAIQKKHKKTVRYVLEKAGYEWNDNVLNVLNEPSEQPNDFEEKQQIDINLETADSKFLQKMTEKLNKLTFTEYAELTKKPVPWGIIQNDYQPVYQHGAVQEVEQQHGGGPLVADLLAATVCYNKMKNGSSKSDHLRDLCEAAKSSRAAFFDKTKKFSDLLQETFDACNNNSIAFALHHDFVAGTVTNSRSFNIYGTMEYAPRVNRDDRRAQSRIAIGDKLKVKILTVDDANKHGCYLLSYNLAKSIVNETKIILGDEAIGSFYAVHEYQYQDDEKERVSMHLNGYDDQEVLISTQKAYVSYDRAHKFKHFEDFIKKPGNEQQYDQQQKRLDVGYIRTIGALGNWTEKLMAETEALCKKPAAELKQMGIVSDCTNNANRIKLASGCSYLWSNSEWTQRGEQLETAKLVARGVRFPEPEKRDFPQPAKALLTYLESIGKLGQYNDKYNDAKLFDMCGINWYGHNGRNQAKQSSFIKQHKEDDRFAALVACVVSRGDFECSLSINGKLGSTSDFRVASHNGDIIEFDMKNGYCMQCPNSHGINATSLRMRPGDARVVFLFRILHPLIKKQALTHFDKCKNIELSDECRCSSVTL